MGNLASDRGRTGIREAEQGRDHGPGFRPPRGAGERSELGVSERMVEVRGKASNRN